jgi:Putative lumazine-binding
MTDEEAITRTVLDYFEGWFDGDASRMERALHPHFVKRSPDDIGLDEDNAQTMIDATKAGLGRRRDPGERGIEVEVVEIHGTIASAVVHSNVYREYLHVARTEDGWKLVNALWSFE